MRAVFEAGIGCARAVVLDGERLVEAHLERPGLRVGDRWAARLLDARDRIVDLPGQPRLERLQPGATEGALVEVEIVREAIDEPDRVRAPHIVQRGMANGGEPARLHVGPGLRTRLVARGIAVADQPAHGPDYLESAGWSDAFEEARTGRVGFPGGELLIERTAAFEAIDVDGGLPPAELALAAVHAVGAAMRRLDLTGSIVVDFPTPGSRAARLAADAALDAALPRPFERTAMNGFGLVQIVRPKLRASLMDHAQADPPLVAALALLRIAERAVGQGTTVLSAAPSVIARIATDWIAALYRRTGRPTELRTDPSLAIWSGHVHVQN